MPQFESQEVECLALCCRLAEDETWAVSQLSTARQAITLAVHSLNKNIEGSLTSLGVRVRESPRQVLTNDIEGVLVEL